MRKGRNPNAKAHTDGFPPLIAFVVTHLPDQEGYHKGRLDVIKDSLLSLREVGIPVFIWDNGSCDALIDWIESYYIPDYFLSSLYNLGPFNAQAAVFRMFPPDTIIAYADDDIHYEPNWLQPQLDILDHFPPAIVSGYPTRDGFNKGHNTKTLEWARNNARLIEKKIMPEEWQIDYNTSLGRTDSAPLIQNDFKIEYNGMEAFATTHHCQFITRARYIAQMKQYTNRIFLDSVEFEKEADASGLLMLSTTERLTRHIGNVLDG